MTGSFLPAVLLLFVIAGIITGLYALAALLRVERELLLVEPFLSGNPPATHAVSRFHVRWYAVTMVFLAFDMEMVFMYPWTRVVSTVGLSSVVEMFVFLGVLTSGVLYAWREGALRWS